MTVPNRKNNINNLARHQANSRVHSEQTHAREIKRLKVKEGKLRYERFGVILVSFLANQRQYVFH